MAVSAFGIDFFVVIVFIVAVLVAVHLPSAGSRLADDPARKNSRIGRGQLRAQLGEDFFSRQCRRVAVVVEILHHARAHQQGIVTVHGAGVLEQAEFE